MAGVHYYFVMQLNLVENSPTNPHYYPSECDSFELKTELFKLDSSPSEAARVRTIVDKDDRPRYQFDKGDHIEFSLKTKGEQAKIEGAQIVFRTEKETLRNPFQKEEAENAFVWNVFKKPTRSYPRDPTDLQTWLLPINSTTGTNVFKREGVYKVDIDIFARPRFDPRGEINIFEEDPIWTVNANTGALNQ